MSVSKLVQGRQTGAAPLQYEDSWCLLLTTRLLSRKDAFLKVPLAIYERVDMLTLLTTYNTLRNTVTAVTSDLRILPQRLDDRVEIMRRVPVGQIFPNGHWAAFLLRFWQDPTQITHHIAEWGYRIKSTTLPEFRAEIQQKGLYKAIADRIDRIPTYREIMWNIVTFVQTLFRTVVEGGKTVGRRGLITLLLFLAVTAVLRSLKRRTYKKYDPNAYSDPRHRPALVGEPNPDDQDRVHEMAQDIAFERTKLFQVHQGVCAKCELHIQRCACPTGPATSMMTNFANQRSKVSSMAHAANKIVNRYQEPWQFNVGDEFVITVCNNVVSRVLDIFSIETAVNWKVIHALQVHDTRPRTEKHIQMGSNRYYVLRQGRLRIVLSVLGWEFVCNLPRKALSIFNVPARDLVINEDHFRLQRRGVVTNEVEKNLPGLLETMLSVPICDPTFLDLGANPLRDAQLIVSAFANEKRLVQNF